MRKFLSNVAYGVVIAFLILLAIASVPFQILGVVLEFVVLSTECGREKYRRFIS